ncbi:MFS transporter [Pedobacter cryoconitis]|uniref:Putative MFS family arabinose efflux permease n=1 Tax=Pedobacter cryoconitis TaxID=188932 RepID=A0A327SQG7_9SPHI|nr:MFS transporter [Pedobacter cryoconitis]RAJ31098.1 putative MFS family arabinose efflux permease [Pedobacter cryoconitis]
MSKQPSKWILLIILSSSIFLSVIDIFIVNVAIPAIKRGIHGTDGDIQLVIALYLLGYAAFLITGGRAGDYYGKKRVFIIAMLSFTFASLLCGISQTAFQLNTARFFQGISAAFMVPQGIAYIQLIFPSHQERIKALGIYGSIAGAASVIGQFLGGILPDTHFFIAGWRLIFLINLPLGIISALMAAKLLKDNTITKTGQFDYSGVFLLTVALVSLIYPLIRGAELGWPWWSIVLIGLSIVLLFIFLYDQKRKLLQRKEPLINIRLFGYKDFNIGLCAVLFYFMAQDSYFLINAILLQTGFGISSSETGIFFVFQGVGYVAASILAIRLIPVYGKKVLQGGVLIMVTALILHILFFKSAAVSRMIFLPILFIYGTGCGAVLPSLLTMALKSIPAKFAGAASGTFSTFQQTAIALGIGIVGGVFFATLGKAETPQAYLSAYQTATILNVILLVLVSFFLFLLPEKTTTLRNNQLD